MGGDGGPASKAPEPARSIALLLLGGVLLLAGFAGLAQLAIDLTAARPRGLVDLHAWTAGLIAPGAAILTIAFDPARVQRPAVGVFAALLPRRASMRPPLSGGAGASRKRPDPKGRPCPRKPSSRACRAG